MVRVQVNSEKMSFKFFANRVKNNRLFDLSIRREDVGDVSCFYQGMQHLNVEVEEELNMKSQE